MCYIKYTVILFFAVVLMAACEEEPTLNDKEDQTKQAINKNELLQKEVNELEDQVNRLMKEKEATEKRYMLSLEANQEWEKNFYNTYPLLKPNAAWDRILIAGSSKGEEIVIEDQNVLEEFSKDLDVKKEIQTGSGTRPDIPQYTYTFEKGEQSLSLQVVGRGNIRLDGKYYTTNKDIHRLGTAFYHAPPYIDPDAIPLFTKLAYSGYIEGEKVYKFGTFSGFRIIGTISPLVENGNELNDKPSDTGEVYEIFHFYYYGEKITVKVFKEKYVHILTEDQSTWYEMKHPTDIGRIFTAG